MTLVNIQDMASYGLGYQWASNVFLGKYKFTVSAQEYLPMGVGWVGPLPRQAPFSIGSTIKLQDMEVAYPEIMADFYQEPSSAEAFNYIYQYNSKSNPMTLEGPVLPKGWRVTAPLSVYLDKSEVTTGNITYTPKTTDASLTAGTVSHSQQGMPASNGSSYTFQFLPGDSSSTSLSYSASNTAGYTTTNGTSSSTSSTSESSFDITNTVTTSAGVKDIASAEYSTSISQGWSNAWTTVSEVNFSKSSDSSTTNSVTNTVTVQPGTATQNSDGSYKYTQEITQPDGSKKVLTVGFTPGLWYTAHITKTESTIQNNLTGTYTIGGSMGTLTDSNKTGGSVSMTAADAIYAASAARFGSCNGTDLSGFDLDLNSPTPRLTVDFTGSAAGTAKIDAGWTITYTENAAMNNSSSGSSSPRMRKSSNHINLNKFDSTKEDGLGVSYKFPKGTSGKASISGTGHPDVVHSLGNAKIQFSKFTDSFLHGNDKKDTFDLARKASGNSIHARGGNDTVISSSSQTASMGEGNDTYKIQSDAKPKSFHQIHLGTGDDEVIVDSARARFNIADFHPFEDTIKVGKSLDEDLLSAKLVPFEKGKKILDNASIEFKYDGSPVGTAYLSGDTDFIQDLVDPVTHETIMALNSTEFEVKDFKDGLSAYKHFAKSVKKGIAYSRTDTPTDWEVMNNDQRADIMTDVYNIHGLDITKEDNLDTLDNHHKPSDFHQVMFG